jgi:hypothetical protein
VGIIVRVLVASVEYDLFCQVDALDEGISMEQVNPYQESFFAIWKQCAVACASFVKINSLDHTSVSMNDICIHRNLFELLLTLGFRPMERASRLLTNPIDCFSLNRKTRKKEFWMHFAEWCVPVEPGLSDV